MVAEDALKQRNGFFFVARSAVVVLQTENADEVVWNECAFFFGGRRGANGNVAIDLTGVGVENGTGVVTRHLQCASGFTDRGGSDENKKCFGGRHEREMNSRKGCGV